MLVRVSEVLQSVIPQNDLECYAWSNIAADNGNVDAKKNQDRCARRLSPEALTRAQDRANEYWEKYGG